MRYGRLCSLDHTTPPPAKDSRTRSSYTDVKRYKEQHKGVALATLIIISRPRRLKRGAAGPEYRTIRRRVLWSTLRSSLSVSHPGVHAHSGSSASARFFVQSSLLCKPLRKAYVVKITTSENTTNNTTCCGVFDVAKLTTSCGVFY